MSPRNLRSTQHSSAWTRATQRMATLREAAAQATRRLGTWAIEQMIQDVPREIEACEFRSEECICRTEGWVACQKRQEMGRKAEPFVVQMRGNRGGLTVNLVAVAVEMEPAAELAQNRPALVKRGGRL